MKRNLETFPIRVALCAFCILLGACTTGSMRLRSSLDEGRELYEMGSYERTIHICSDIIHSPEALGHEEVAAQAYKLRGASRKEGRSYSRARSDFDAAIKMAGEADFSPHDRRSFLLECEMSIGDTYIHEGRLRTADQIFRDLMNDAATTRYRDQLLFRRYVCAYKLGRSDPERFLGEIASMRNLDEAALRREFMAGRERSFDPAPEPSPYKVNPSLSSGVESVLPRSRWRARPTKLVDVNPMTTITRITVHHTGEECEARGFEESARRIRSYQAAHQDGRGWADIGYHFVIDRAGRVWEARPLKYQGAHAGNHTLNRGNIGISLIGNYNTQRLTHGQKETLSQLLSVLCDFYGLSRSTGICTHKELHNTACPGIHLQAFIDQYRRVHL